MDQTNEIRPGIDLNFLTLAELKSLKKILCRQKEHPNPTIAARSQQALNNVLSELEHRGK